MPTYEQFLRGIEADAASDYPRLVFADWLEEQGETERAAFIRLQCEAYQIAHGPPPRRWNELSAKEQKKVEQLKAKAEALLKPHREAWTKGLPKWAIKDVEFQRGFPHFFYITAKQLIDDGVAIRKVAPLGGYLSLRLLKGREADVFACEHLQAVTRLHLDGCELTDADVQLLIASPYLSRVEELNLSRGGLGSLDKAVNRLTDAAVVALSRAKNLPSLRWLYLQGLYKNVTAAGIRALVESPLRAELTSLDVSSGPGGPAFAEVFQSPRFRLKHLQILNVGDRRLGDAGAIALAGCSALASLVELRLHQNNLTDEGAKAILESPYLRNVQSVSFWENPRLTDVTAKSILADRRKWQMVELDSTVSETLLAEVAARCKRNDLAKFKPSRRRQFRQ